MNITAKTKICMVIGDPIDHSLSPKMHNAGYIALSIESDYIYVACHVKVADIKQFIDGIRAMNIHGVSLTIPHKIAVMPYLDKIDEVAQKIGAVNTIVNENGMLTGYNTDWQGILIPLEKMTDLSGKSVAVLGAGGAARAAVYALSTKKARVSIFNRTIEKAANLANDFGGEAFSLDELERIKQMDIIINTTSVGLKNINESLVPLEYINKHQIVFDAVYGNETQLIHFAKSKSAKTITGLEMLLYQGAEQFSLFTGYSAPVIDMKNALL